VQISCAFATTLGSAEHIRIAEQLGYDRAWLYDTPQQSPDVWMVLTLAATRTERIGLGPGVLVPTLRHPMVNAAATSALQALAPGRVAVAFGTGFTGRRAMGYGAITWAYMERYINAYTGLLRGETIEWEGARMRMMHPHDNAGALPDGIPILIGATGPKGRDLARRLGHGVLAATQLDPALAEFSDVSFLYHGTVRDDDETPTDEHQRATTGPGFALIYHSAYEFAGSAAMETLPGGRQWLAVINTHPDNERHLGVHTGHLIAMNDADHAAWDAGGAAIADQLTISGTTSEVARRLDELAEQGVTELIYQPAGPDIPGQLERMLAAAQQVKRPVRSARSPRDVRG
jgi:5,10-methylenetetrahydromethanopterin reductase